MALAPEPGDHGATAARRTYCLVEVGAAAGTGFPIRQQLLDPERQRQKGRFVAVGEGELREDLLVEARGARPHGEGPDGRGHVRVGDQVPLSESDGG